MKLARVTVLANECIMPNTHVLTLDSPYLGQSAVPGQFVHLRVDQSWDPLLRRPMSIFRITPKGVSLMVRAVGRGSDRIARAHPGALLDCLGPLGNGFSIDASSRCYLLVGGGYGVAPLIGLAERVLACDAEVVLLVGAASTEYVFPSTLVPSAVEYHAATVDGSLGHHGLVTELMGPYLAWADSVVACGPTAMLESVERESSATPGRNVQLAMEQQMGCAMGVCLGCVVPTERGYKRVCRDGPVFAGGELVWR